MIESGKKPTKRRYRYYEILEVRRDATQDILKRSYRKLAKMYHPDKNPNPGAHDKFKKINEAYEILCKPDSRTAYDNSFTECPLCYTHEVIQTAGTQWRCRHCGCKFDPTSASEFIEQVEQAAIPERLRTAVRIFQTTQCSWCSRFYTHPSLCPARKLKSNCNSFDVLAKEKREKLIGDERWWWRMSDMLQQVQGRGIMAKCREQGCFALNPNPQRRTCWQCGKDSLSCPGCREAPILIYDMETHIWKCPNAIHSKKYTYTQTKRAVKLTLSQDSCPNCNSILYYDAAYLLFRCKNCGRIYSPKEIHREPFKKRERQERSSVKAKPRRNYARRSTSTSTSTSTRPRAKNKATLLPGWLMAGLVFFVIMLFGFVIYSLLG